MNVLSEAERRKQAEAHKVERARLAGKDLVVLCAHRGCEDWRGTTLREQDVHIQRVHGIDQRKRPKRARREAA
jgi:hypothetical protein